MTTMIRLFILAGVMSVVLLTPADGQLLVGVGIGKLWDANGSGLVGEVTLSKATGPVTPNIIFTFDLDGDGRPVIQPQVGRTIIDLDVAALDLDVGASAGPGDSHWEPHVAVTTVAYLIGPLKVGATFAWQPWKEWARSSLIKLDMAF